MKFDKDTHGPQNINADTWLKLTENLSKLLQTALLISRAFSQFIRPVKKLHTASLKALFVSQRMVYTRKFNGYCQL